MPHFINRYDPIAVDYSKKRSKPWKFFLDFLECINDFNNSEDQIIKGICCDLGSGAGRHQEILTEKTDIYIGADLSFEMLKIAKSKADNNKVNQQWLMCDIENIPIRPNSITTVVSIAVIHHILGRRRRQKVIKKICEITQREGFIIVSVWSATQGKNSFVAKKATFRSRMFGKKHLIKSSNGKNVKLKRNDIILPWSVISKENKRIEVQRVYHLFSFGELKEFQTKNLNTILIRSLGNEKTGNNYFLLLKKL